MGPYIQATIRAVASAALQGSICVSVMLYVVIRAVQITSGKVNINRLLICPHGHLNTQNEVTFSF